MTASDLAIIILCFPIGFAIGWFIGGLFIR